jgi:hypothetical protein
MNSVVTSRAPASVLGFITVAIRVLDIAVLSFGRGEFAAADSSSRGGGGLTGVMGRFPGVSSVNAGVVFSPPFEAGFLLDSWLNAKACLTGVTADVDNGFLGVVTGGMALLAVGMFSERGIREDGSLVLLDGDGIPDASGGKNRGGAEIRAWIKGFFGVTAFGLNICEGNAFLKTTGRS